MRLPASLSRGTRVWRIRHADIPTMVLVRVQEGRVSSRVMERENRNHTLQGSLCGRRILDPKLSAGHPIGSARFSTPVCRISNEKYVHDSAGGAYNAGVASLASGPSVSHVRHTAALSVSCGHSSPYMVDTKSELLDTRIQRCIQLRSGYNRIQWLDTIAYNIYICIYRFLL